MGQELDAIVGEKERYCCRYLILRLLIILLGFVLVSIFQESRHAGAAPELVFALLAAYLVFGVASFATFHLRARRAQLMHRQVIGDFLFQSALVWATGGVLSIFTPLLFVTLVAATRLISVRGSFILATVATLALTATAIAYAFGIAPNVLGRVNSPLGGEQPTLVIAYLVASVLGLYITSALGSILSHGLRSIEGIQSEILENMAEGLIALGSDGRVIHLNRESRRLFGLQQLALGAKVTLSELLPGERFRRLRQAFERGERRRFETPVSNLSGEERYAEVKISTVKDTGGAARFTIGLISDLTLKREVQAAENRIQKLEGLQIMAMGIAHEIRNPLASIRGCVQEIAKREQDERQQKFMGIVCKESDRLDRIIEDFLLYARSGPTDLVPLDIVEVIEEALLLLRSRSEFGGREIVWQRPAERPRVFGDRNRLIQVFLNLGINSIEATLATEGKIHICLRPRDHAEVDRRREDAGPAQGIDIELRDNGEGMEEAELDKLFTPFFTTKARGNGLGMCVVEKIVREHMGILEVSSDRRRGTTVRIWLPVLGNSVPHEESRENEGAGQERAELVCHV